MKVCVIQPPYSRDLSEAEALFDYKIKALDALRGPMDIIVFPE